MLTLCYASGRRATAAKAEFNDMLPECSVENVPASKTAGKYLFILFYIVNHKKRNILFLTITLANLSRFL